jgi:hypothetical protein
MTMADENNSAAIYTLMAAPSVSLADARRIGEELSVNWSVVPVEEFRGALATELEHADVTHGDLAVTGRIALAHLREDPGYYGRLARAEAEAEAYWATRQKPSPTLGGARNSAWTVTALVVVALAIIVFFARVAWRWKCRHRAREEFLYNAPFLTAGFPIQFDPAYSSPFETDYCWHAPAACAGFALEPSL